MIQQKKIPKVLILGRPNVGKSTLINRIIKKNKAITWDEPGVTRDLSYFNCNWKDKEFYLVDSGGVFFSKNKEVLQDQVEEQVKRAIDEADAVILVTDARAGVHPLDEIVAEYLRPFKEKVLLAVNKADNSPDLAFVPDFFKLGLNDPIAVSALQGHGIPELLDKATQSFSQHEQNLSESLSKAYKVAIIGRPNVGKSSLVNALFNDKKMIVDDRAGTTRDAVELYFQHQDHQYVFIDTAGLRKKAKVSDKIEFFSTVRTHKAIEEADIVIVLMEVEPFLTDQDKKIIRMVLDANRNMILFINKWDKTGRSHTERQDLIKIAQHDIPPLEHVPFIFGSATEKINIGKLFSDIPEVIKRSEQRVPTGELNRFIERIIRQNPPPAKSGQAVRVYYGTQAETKPPTFIFFVNNAKYINESYIRFVEKRIRANLGDFTGVPMQIFFKDHKENNTRKAPPKKTASPF